MSATTTAVCSVPYTLTPPDILEHDGRTALIGATVYRALALLARSGNRTVTIQNVCQDIWRTETVVRHDLYNLVYRINERFSAVGCSLRCSVDDDVLILI